MHILLVTRNDPFSVVTGTEGFVKNLSLELARLGHNVIIVSGTSARQNPLIKPSQLIERHGIRHYTFRYLAAFEFYLRCGNLLKKIVKDREIDAIIGFAGSPLGNILGFFRGLPDRPPMFYFCIDCRATLYKMKWQTVSSGIRARMDIPLRSPMEIYFDKNSCLRTDLVIASCKATAEDIISMYGVHPNKIRILYLGIPNNYAYGYKSNDPEVPIFIHISTDPERRGTAYFIKAVRILQDYGFNVRGVIVGRPGRYYVDLAKGLDIDFLSNIPLDELKRLYASSTCHVSPSIADAFNFPVIESACFGKPSIVSNIASLPELVSDGLDGFVVPVADSKSLADAMRKLLENPTLKAEMKKNALVKSTRFTINKTALRLLDVVQEFNRGIR
jgi:glycosyltransferase involved in cell wall biosynthesis